MNMEKVEKEEYGSWYKDESGSEVFIPFDNDKAIETWKQASSSWQLAKTLGVHGRSK